MTRPSTPLRQLLGLLALIALLALSQPLTSAQTNCDPVVGDSANLFADDLERVENAANALSRLDADVHIRTVSSYAPAASLDEYADQLVRDCPAWQGADGQRKPNLLLLLVAIQERETGTYYGARWKSALDGTWEQIQADEVGPRFRDGDFAGGVVAGLQEIQERIDPNSTQQTAADTESSGFPVGGLGVLGLLGAVGGGAYGANKYRQERRRRQAAQARAREAKRGAVEYVVALPERVKHLEARVTSSVPQVAAEDGKPLTKALDAAKKSVNTLLLDFGELDESDPERKGLNVAGYDQISAAFQAICDKAQHVVKAADELEALLAKLDAAMQQTPQAIVEGKGAIEQATTTIAAIDGQGFKTEAPRQLLAEAQTNLADAERALQERRFIRAAQLTSTAVGQITQAVADAQALPKLKQESEIETIELEQRIEQVAAQIEPARQTLNEISRIAATQCWETLRDHPTTAEQHVTQSRHTLEAVRPLITMERQSWPQALEQLASANGLLDQAEQLIDGIGTLKHKLDAAIRDAPGAIEQAQTALSDAEAYIRKHDPDIRDSLWDELRAAEKQLDVARTELRAAKPDYLQALAQAQQVQQTAHKLHQQGKAEHEAQVQLRRQALAELKEAREKIAQAQAYIASHRRDVQNSTESSIPEAEQLMTQAARMAEPQKQLDYAQAAREIAERAYEQARQEVSAAQASRRQEREWLSSSGGSGSSSGGGSSGSSSGGSSSWGSSSGGSSSWDSSSGGSSSWGSSSGGGGSSKW